MHLKVTIASVVCSVNLVLLEMDTCVTLMRIWTEFLTKH